MSTIREARAALDAHVRKGTGPDIAFNRLLQDYARACYYAAAADARAALEQLDFTGVGAREERRAER